MEIGLSTGVSLGARIFAAICGIVLSAWTVRKLSKRELLIPISSLNLAVGIGLTVFALVPGLFDQLSYAIGIKYPPLLYIMLAVLTVLVLVLFLSAQLSVLDGRCRRLAQEISMLRNEFYDGRSARIEPQPERASRAVAAAGTGRASAK
jgi:hypothetical protein